MDSSETSVATTNIHSKLRNIIPLSRTSRNIVEEWGLSPSPADTRLLHTLRKTLKHLTTALSTVRQHVEKPRANKGITYPATDSDDRSLDYRLFKSLWDSLTVLAESRLIGIIRNRKHLVDALAGAISRHRAHSAATPTHTQAALQ